ncbi:MAG: hypothetical protein R3C39_10735 [Dehalococcoidia bacterium]
MPTLLLVAVVVLTCLGLLIAMVARSPRPAVFVRGAVAIAGLFELLSTAASEGASVLGTFVVVAAALLAVSAAGLIGLVLAVEAARRLWPCRVQGGADGR